MAHPRLFLFIGFPGAGKTTVAKIIAERSGAVHLWADQERHEMFSAPTHAEAESVALYERLNTEAGELLQAGKSVIFDTNFNFYADRQKLRDIAAKYDAEVCIVWVTTPYPLAKKRAVSQSSPVRNGYQMTMSNEQFDAIAAKLEEPTEHETFIQVDGSDLDEADLLAQLQL